MLNALLLEVVGHLARPDVRPEGHWSRVHHILDCGRRISCQLPGVDEPQHDTISINDDQRLAAIAADAIAHIAHTLVESARVNVTLGYIRDSRDMGISALTRQPRSEPVGPPSLVAVDVSEPERGEPRRGPCAHVSLVVMAVGNGGSAGVEPFGGRSIQVLQRDVDGTGNMFRLVFLRAEDINELSTLPDELLDGVTVDHRGHVYLLLVVLQRVGGEPFRDARKPSRSTASSICGTVTCVGSYTTTASFDRRLTSARLTPFSPSRAFFTPTGQAPHVIPSTARTTVEVAAIAVSETTTRPSSRASTDAHRLIAHLPCCGRREADRRS